MSIDADFVGVGPLGVQQAPRSAGRDASGIQPGVRDETGGVVSGGGKSIGNVSEKDVHVSTLQTVDLTENRISAVDILYIVYINFHFRQCCR